MFRNLFNAVKVEATGFLPSHQPESSLPENNA
ncbi:MAG: hypothetical protein ACD_45C00088G0001, partial [uncultured bacterium]